LRDSGEVSQKTSYYYLQAAKQFCNWMLKDKRTGGESPLKHLDAVKVTHKVNRRAMTPDELWSLLEATEAAPERFGMTGHQRTMLYLLATYTGLRPNEIRNLTVSSFDFDNCTVNVKAAYSKRRREDVLPLRKDTAEAMKELLRNKTPNAKVFDLPSKYRMADMIRADLEDVGINWQDNGEGVLDFYSLRHSTASLLAASGVNPKTAQSIMRHSDINLTMSRYSHVFRGAESKAVESLPDFTSQGRKRQSATGTEGKPLELHKRAYKKLTKKSYFDCNSMSSIGFGEGQNMTGCEQNRGNNKPLQMTDLGTKKEPLSSTDIGSKTNTPGRIRTCGLRIRNPLLYPSELRALFT
jgi:integrase